MGRERLRGLRSGALIAVLTVAPQACSVQPDGAEHGDYARFASFGSARELVIGAQAGWAHAAALRMVPRLELQLGHPVRVVELEEARPAAQRLRMLIATPTAGGLEGVVGGLAQLDPSLADFAREADARGAALIATLPDPLRPASPLTVCLAVPGSELVDPGLDLDLGAWLEPVWRRGWQRFEGSALVASSADADGSTRALGTAATDAVAADAFSAHAAALGAELATLLGPPARELATPRLRLWDEPVDLARAAGGFAPFVARPAAGLLELARDAEPGEARRGLTALLARAGWGEPREAWLVEGLGVHLADSWWGADLGRWCARLSRDELVLDIDQLAADGEASPHQLGPLRGLLVGALLRARGAEGLRRAWNDGLAIDPGLREAFEARLDELAALHAAELGAGRRAELAAVLARPFRHGVNLVVAGSDPSLPEAGFGSRGAAQRMARLAELGADAVAFDWAVALECQAPRLAYYRHAPRGAQADDLALAVGARAAAAQGLDLLLKPHLWISDSGTFAGWALVHSQAEWQRYFEAERRLVRHCGLLAELIGAEVLCLGAEQRNASVTIASRGDSAWGSEHFAWKRARWAEVIATARAAFDGGLTYAAHWDGERDGVAFWEQLDFMGLDLYAPLRPGEPGPDGPIDLAAVRGNLWYALTQAMAAADERGLRVLVTEIGFPAAGGAWTNPELPAGPPDAQRPVRMLEALADALRPWAGQSDVLAGLFLWNVSCAAPEPQGELRTYGLEGALVEPALRRVFALP